MIEVLCIQWKLYLIVEDDLGSDDLYQFADFVDKSGDEKRAGQRQKSVGVVVKRCVQVRHE